MDIELTKLLISETRKSLNKLSVAEQQALAATGDNSFYHPFLHNAGYQEAVQEIKLFVKQLENLTGVEFIGSDGSYITASGTTDFIEINLQAIERLITVFSASQADNAEPSVKR